MTFSNKNYDLETRFTVYSYSRIVFYDFIKRIKNVGINITSIIGDDVEYYSDFEYVINKDFSNGLIIMLNNDYSIHFNTNKHKDSIINSFSFYFEFEEILYKDINSFIEKSKDIYYSYITNYYDVKWQDEESISSYKINKKSLKGLSYGIDLWDEKCIDTSKNYGRSIYRDGILYIASYCTWFGDIINESIIDEIDFTYSKRKLQNGLIEVKLFKDILGDYSKYRKKQKEFLNKIGLTEDATV
ncbi:hypothetical protein [Flavivirga rizhaonensis]|uniref:Uncharacterized protein n=1 Tax=Flavivirga rizhaonensis TaxID=2559571 RepID=A0A4V3P4D7_9FLAO|nr:hypothetical protein [Flavivirga rizhaonensis]TGV01074.1 hypothetical protein EM932_17085 [Flavivirga rizhaonensis]